MAYASRPVLPFDDDNSQDIHEENGVVCEDVSSTGLVPTGIDALELGKEMNDPLSRGALTFKVVSVRIITTDNEKYVAYTVMVSFAEDVDDFYPAIFERRYNDFFELYSSLKRTFPQLLGPVQFPKKAIVGNFSPGTITERMNGFQNLLHVIASQAQLRSSPVVSRFLQRRELNYALNLIHDEQFDEAFPLVENSFRLMNKLQTDRSPLVLRNLCLLICVYSKLENPRAMDLACLAVRRFQGVSDSDLLRYYVPLLNISLELSEKYGKGTTLLEEHLSSLRKRGVALHDSTPLLSLLVEDFGSSM